MGVTKVSAPHLDEELPLKQWLEHERAAMSVRDRTIAQYAGYLGAENATVDPRAWKLLKTHDKIKIFRSRERLQPNVFAEESSDALPALAPTRWAPYTVLLSVGTIDGSLDDVMYGAVTPTEHAMATRSVLVSDEFKQHCVLQDIKLPTTENPFQYVGLKWAFRAAEIASIVRARDLVYVEASGFRSMRIGGQDERVGYVVNHSVEIPELNSRKKKIVRGRLSLCMLFRQKAAGVVDVYTAVTADPGGNVKPKMAASTYARALVALSNVADCSLLKKLAWLQKQNAAKNGDGACVAVAKVQGSHWCCLQCTRNLSSFSSLTSCGVCKATVCSRCVTNKKLVLGGTAQGLAYKSVQVCKGCISLALHGVDAAEVATDEFVRNWNRRRDPPATELELKSEDVFSPTFTASSSDMSLQVENITEESVVYSSSEEEDDDSRLEYDFGSPPPRRLELSELEEEDEEVIEVKPVPVGEADKMKLLQQMNELRMQAEVTFNLTMRQTKTLQRSKLGDLEAKRALSRSAIY